MQCKAQRCYDSQSRQLKYEGEKKFSALCADGSPLCASTHCLRQWPYHSKNASYGSVRSCDLAKLASAHSARSGHGYIKCWRHANEINWSGLAKLDPPKHAFINPVVTAAATMYQKPVAFSYSLQAP